jgi:hypothetical protein
MRKETSILRQYSITGLAVLKGTKYTLHKMTSALKTRKQDPPKPAGLVTINSIIWNHTPKYHSTGVQLMGRRLRVVCVHILKFHICYKNYTII